MLGLVLDDKVGLDELFDRNDLRGAQMDGISQAVIGAGDKSGVGGIGGPGEAIGIEVSCRDILFKFARVSLAKNNHTMGGVKHYYSLHRVMLCRQVDL